MNQKDTPVMTRQIAKKILDKAIQEGKSVQKVITEMYSSVHDRLFVLDYFCKEYFIKRA